MKYCTVCKTKYDDSVSFCPVDGEVLEDDPSSIVDTVLDGQYHIESLLGKGGMGAVFRARHILLGDRVAIKILPPEMRNNAEWLRRFRREGQAARRFRHPNAVTVYDLRTASDGMIYMVMEYVEGHTLDAELKVRGTFSPGEALTVLEPILSVLNAAHAMGVVHRDLKPENIMIGKPTPGSELNVKLLDLGIAKLSEVAGAETGKNTALTMAGQMLGTPYYMSPEQWGELPRDGNSEIDGRADIYSLALVFYEMIAGLRPYRAQTLLELRKEHVSVMPRPLNEVVPGVSLEFGRAIARGMAKDRSDRPATAGDFARELKSALGSVGNGSYARARLANLGSSNSAADTKLINQASNTKSDVDAPTIITSEVSAPETTSARRPEAEPEASLETAATVVESAGPASIVTSPSLPAEPAERVAPAPAQRSADVPATIRTEKRGGSALLVIGGVIMVILLVLGVGGFLLVNSLRSRPTGTRSSNDNTSATEAPTSKEVARYWLEVIAPDRNAKPVRVVPVVPIASSQQVKFHFSPVEGGFLYIIGPGDQNRPTAFLTAKADAEATGLTSNEVKQGAELSFPSGSLPDGQERWLGLDKNPGTERYTLIFSTTRLQSPQFLNDVPPGQALTVTQQQELTSFLAKYKTPETEYNSSNSAAPFVTLKAPAQALPGSPLIFEIRIEHK